MKRLQFSLRTLVLATTLMPVLIWAFYALYMGGILGVFFGVFTFFLVMVILVLIAPSVTAAVRSLTAAIRSFIASIIASLRPQVATRGEFARLLCQHAGGDHEQHKHHGRRR